MWFKPRQLDVSCLCLFSGVAVRVHGGASCLRISWIMCLKCRVPGPLSTPCKTCGGPRNLQAPKLPSLRHWGLRISETSLGIRVFSSGEKPRRKGLMGSVSSWVGYKGYLPRIYLVQGFLSDPGMKHQMILWTVFSRGLKKRLLSLRLVSIKNTKLYWK